eukprot:1969480-Pleurochrysis_carterae.AAC.5
MLSLSQSLALLGSAPILEQPGPARSVWHGLCRPRRTFGNEVDERAKRLAAEVRAATESTVFDMASCSGAGPISQLVNAGFGQPLPLAHMVRLSFIVGGGKKVRQRYDDKCVPPAFAATAARVHVIALYFLSMLVASIVDRDYSSDSRAFAKVAEGCGRGRRIVFGV